MKWVILAMILFFVGLCILIVVEVAKAGWTEDALLSAAAVLGIVLMLIGFFAAFWALLDLMWHT